MLKVFTAKRGSQLVFIIKFKNLNQDLSSIQFGLKEDYDKAMLILKTLNDGITKLSTTEYQVNISTSDILGLEAGMYVYDLRYTIGETPSIPLSGYLVVNDSVFANNNQE